MLKTIWLTVTSLIILALVFGCGGRAVKRAPVDTVPRDLELDVRIEMLEEMAINYPDDPNLYYQLGNLFYEAAMPNDASDRPRCTSGLSRSTLWRGS